MKKIYIVSNAYKPSYGGLVSYMDNIAEEVSLNKKDRSELIYLNNDDINNSNQIKYNSIKLEVKGLKKLFSPYYTVNYLKKLIDENKIFYEAENAGSEYIIIRHFYFAAAIAMSKNKKIIDKCIFLIPLLAPVHQKVLIKKSSFIKKMYYMLIQNQIKYFERKAIFSDIKLATLSYSKKEEVQEYYNAHNKNIAVINPGISHERFQISEKNIKSVDLIKEKIKDKFILLTVCRLSAEKNIILLLDWLKYTNQSGVHLFIVGTGEDEKRLKKITVEYNISDHVTFFGYQKETELYYLAADLFILASTYEGFGHVFLEALASSTPVIGLRSKKPEVITASEEIIEDGYNGFLIENDIQDLDDKINKLRSDKDLIKQMKYNAKKSSEKYQWSIHLQEIINEVNNK